MKTERRTLDKKFGLAFRGAIILQLILILCLGLSLWDGVPGGPRRVAAQGTDIAWDDFESGGWSGGGGWADSRWNDGGDSDVTNDGTPHGGSYHLRLRRGNGRAYRTVNLAGASNVRLRFWWKADSFESGENAQVIVNDGSDHVVLQVNNGDDDNVYHYAEVDLSSYSMVSDFELRFEANMSGRGDRFYVDDVRIATYSVLDFFSLDADPGWTTEGDWAFGVPAGGGGEYGNPDPTGGHTGSYVYGYNLDGDYANYLPEYNLTTTAIDCSAYADVTLRFWRWLNVEQPAYDHAYIRVSANGSDWTTVWQNAVEIADGAWQQVSYDISSVADGQSTVYIRWVMGTTDSGWRYSGWNIDDVELVGYPIGPTPTPTNTPTATATPTSTPTATPTPTVGSPTPTPTPPDPCTFFEQSGQVVVEAEHYLDHVHPGEHSWQMRTSQPGYSTWGYMETQPNDGTIYQTFEDLDDSPYLEYRVYFSTPGTYYVWVRGWAANSADNSIHAGLDGTVTGASDRISNFDYYEWDWSRTTMDSGSPAAYIDVDEAGLHTFNLFMREDGFLVDKVVLTTSDSSTPPADNIAESPCCEPPDPPPTPGPPPGHRDCSQVLLQGNFEGDVGAWHLGEELDAAERSGNESRSGFYSLVLRCFELSGHVFHPWAYQEVALPSDLVADTELALSLYYFVDPRSTPREEDVLDVKLRDAGGADITADTAIANGASTASTWVQYSVDLADGLADPASYADQDVQLYFHAPNPDDLGTTGFYIDDVRLDVCNTEPIPDIDPDKATVGGNLRVWMEGRLTEMVGVTVWAYRTDGGECRPGENLCVTSSIHDSTYHFYNVEPGEYVIYAETVVGTQIRFDTEAVTLEAGDVIEDVHLAL